MLTLAAEGVNSRGRPAPAGNLVARAGRLLPQNIDGGWAARRTGARLEPPGQPQEEEACRPRLNRW